MSEVKKEIPEGRNSAEMTLVRLLKKHRCWNDVKEITSALWRIGFIADQMEKEHKLLSDNGSCEAKGESNE